MAIILRIVLCCILLIALLRSHQECDSLLLNAFQTFSLSHTKHPNLSEQVSPHHDGLNNMNGEFSQIIYLLGNSINFLLCYDSSLFEISRAHLFNLTDTFLSSFYAQHNF